MIRAARRPAAAIAVAVALFASSGAIIAYARFNSLSQNPGNSFAAATLAAPGTPTSTHPNVSGTGTGNVALTWPTSTTPWTQSYGVQRAPATTGTPTWTNIGTLSAAACSTTCSYTDPTNNFTTNPPPSPQYGQQYLYQVQSTYASWSATGGAGMALSLSPVTGTAAGTSTDTTGGFSEQPALPTAGSQPGQVTAGGTGDGNLYFVEQGGPRLGRLSTAGSLVELLLNTGWTPWGITMDAPDGGNIYFTENSTGASSVGRLIASSLSSTACSSKITNGQISYANLTSCGGLVEWTVNASSNVGLRGIVGDASNVYVAENGANKIGEIAIATGTTVKEVSVGAGPLGVTIPSFDTTNVYFTESAANKIGKVHANSQLNQLKESSAITGASPSGIVAGTDGNLWFTEAGAGAVAKMDTSLSLVPPSYPIPSSGSSPTAITVGPNGNLWVAESGASRIAILTTSGAFTEYAIPTASSAPGGIVQGSDGNMWLTESATTANRVAAFRFAYSLTATDVTRLSTGDAIRFQTEPWLPTASTSTFAQALTLAPAAAIVPAGGAAITSVRVVLNYQAPPVIAGQNNTSAGLQVGISNNSGATFTYYALPNPQQATCPSPGGGATESCTFASPNVQVLVGIPSSVVGTPAQLTGLLVQVRAAPGTGSAFTLGVDLAHVDVN